MFAIMKVSSCSFSGHISSRIHKKEGSTLLDGKPQISVTDTCTECDGAEVPSCRCFTNSDESAQKIRVNPWRRSCAEVVIPPKTREPKRMYHAAPCSLGNHRGTIFLILGNSSDKFESLMSFKTYRKTCTTCGSKRMPEFLFNSAMASS